MMETKRMKTFADTLDGQFCYDSCRTQAWSASTILDVLEEMHKINRKA
jgi:glycogen debranching enzyme